MVSDLSSLPSASPQASPHPEDDEVNIQRWARVLASRWAILALGALLGALLGFAATLRTPRVYEAAAIVRLAPTTEPSGLFSAAGARTLLSSQTIASQVIEELRAAERGYEGSVQEFLAHSLTVENIPSTHLFRVTVRLTDPQLASKAATRTAEGAAERMSVLWGEVAAGKPTELERQLEQARLALSVAEQQLSDYLRRSSSRRESDPPLMISRASPGPLYPLGSERGQLEAEVEIKRRTFIEAGARHALARIEMTAANPPLRLIDAATVPVVPIPRPRIRSVTLGLLAGLVAAACIVVFREWRGPQVPPRGEGRSGVVTQQQPD